MVWHSASIGFTRFCFSNHSFCSWPIIQKLGCTPSCGNMWEAQSHDQPPDGICGYRQEFFIFLVTSWQTPSCFIYYWPRAETIRQSWKLRPQTAHQEILNSKEFKGFSLSFNYFFSLSSLIVVAEAIFTVIWQQGWGETELGGLEDQDFHSQRVDC